MISRRRFAVCLIAAVVVIAALIGFIAFRDAFNSGLGGLMVYWDGEPESGTAQEIDYTVSGGAAFVSKMYLVKTDTATQLNFRFTYPGLKDVSDIKLYLDGEEILNRTGLFYDSIMGIKCYNTHVSLKSPKEDEISGNIMLVVYEGDSSRLNFEVEV